ncbi:MAG: type II toxin-antitoxin system RelE/ParE family toxin [Rubrivivax sp.]
MTLHLRISARATAQIERADAWWRENRRSVSGAVRDDLRAAFQVLLRQPGIGVEITSARLGGTRRVHLDRIRYYLYYRVKGDELAVLSVWHSNRGREPRI